MEKLSLVENPRLLVSAEMRHCFTNVFCGSLPDYLLPLTLQQTATGEVRRPAAVECEFDGFAIRPVRGELPLQPRAVSPVGDCQHAHSEKIYPK
jgi:hypothetical protein